MTDNLSLVLYKKNDMKLEQRPLPKKPSANEVKLATHTVGICGSDVKYWLDGKIGHFILKAPMVLGHETSAVVVEVGEKVNNLKVGDRVAVEVGVPCSCCMLCKTGKYNLCPDMAFAATPPFDGTLARFFNHKADFCFKLPESVSLEEGAMIEPLAVAVHACQRAPAKLNDIVLVTGAGAIGLLCLLTAKAFGAAHIIITDVQESRLAFAKTLGASATFLVNPKEDNFTETLANKIGDYCAKQFCQPEGQVGIDVSYECSGAESSISLAIKCAKPGSTIVCVGCQQDTVKVPLGLASMREVDVKGVFRYRNCYPLALGLVESKKINLKPLISHRFTLEESVEAFTRCSKGEGIKILINCSSNKTPGN